MMVPVADDLDPCTNQLVATLISIGSQANAFGKTATTGKATLCMMPRDCGHEIGRTEYREKKGGIANISISSQIKLHI